MKDILNKLLKRSSDTYWRLNIEREGPFLTHTIDGYKVYFWVKPQEIKTHSAVGNAYVTELLGRRADRIDNLTVHVWKM